MMKRLLFTLALAAAAFTAQADEARLLRFPSTDGNQIVFSYGGDLYKAPLAGGQATRLTSHIGYEMFARFSPDSKSIAFTGEYDGNREVYLIPAQGGEPVRLTYSSTNSRDDLGDRMGPNNIVMAWSKDGKKIIYRNRTGDGFPGKLWTISPDGGMPEQIPLPEGGFCSYSPDGKKLAYNRVMREFRTWKYYRGGMADDIWVYDPAAKKVENVTNNVAQDIFPMWIGEEIFFISDRDMTMNLFVYNTRTKQTEKVTNFTDYDIKFPSTNGEIIVFEKGGYLYKFDPKSRQSQKISIELTSDNIYGRQQMKDVSGKASARGASIPSDGSRVAVTARGEVFSVPVGEGVVRNITRTPGSNDRNAVWSPDGKYIAYIGDATGETEVYLQPAEGGKPVQLTKNNDTYIRRVQWSPDSKKIYYSDRKNRLVEVDVATKAKRTVMENPAGEFRSVNFSPCGNWIAYTKSAENEMSVVYVYNLKTGKEIAVTEKWYSSSSPVFSTDGKYIIFTSARDFNPVYGQLEWNHTYSNMNGLYMAMLAKGTASPLLPEDGKAPAPKGAPEKKDAAAAPAATVIDADGIFGRIVRIPVGTGFFGNFVCDGKKLWYSSGRDTKVFDFATGKDEKAAEGASMVSYNPGAKKALFAKGRDLYVCDFPAPKVAFRDKVSFKNLVAPVDYTAEWAQIYDEVWRAFRDGFYLENMHGIDWKAIKEKYAVLLPYVKTRLDLNYVIGEMISEVACGHAYVNPGEMPKAERIPMGLLGAELKKDKSGYYKIGKIMPGAPYSKSLRSPLTEPGLNVAEGNYIVAIDGIPTNTVDNIYKLLIGKANVLTELSVNDKPSEVGAREIVVKPIDNEYPLEHYNWVQNNIKKVEQATGGRVGYIYIPDMSVEGLNEFARYFYPQLDKEALIIDDRANGGGNVSPMIIERLLRKTYRMTMYRNSDRNGTIPDATHHGPKVLLINKYSASDGDLFPWSFKANNLGTVIGTRTWGGIVGISGSLPYIDGTDVRVPFFTNYDAKTGKWIVENHGVDPDILIDNDPIKEQQGIDEQLNKAIEVIMEQLKERKPLPKTPAPRTLKDLGLN
ncbi:MAG: PDZ domain-containing protein [Bacteroidales bacterium]|nr:PDZ domain-containing protein [Bacteroidales bacterium]